MSHQFDIGDRVVVTAEYDGPKVYNRITQGSIGVVEDIEGASMPYYVHFEELDDREWFYGNELAAASDVEFQIGDYVQHTFTGDPEPAEYYGVSGFVIEVFPEDGEVTFLRSDNDEVLGCQDYELSLVYRQVNSVTQASESDDDLMAVVNAVSDPGTAPAHYRALPNGIECIDVIQFFNFPVGSAIKYLWRHELKGDPIENLRKAIQNIEFEITRREEAL